MCKKEKENHTHRQRQFIPYFSETETSGDIISERERKKEKGSVEQAKRKTKKIVFFSFLVVDLCQKQTNRTSAAAAANVFL